MIANARLLSHQLVTPDFDDPGDLVAWMGAIQAQNCNMAKWAVGIRLKSVTNQAVGEALRRGDILRTHVMRPTWHFVAAEDIRWMLKLSAEHIKSAIKSYSKSREQDITEQLYYKCNCLIEKILEGNKSLTKEELGVELGRAGITVDNSLIARFVTRAEVEGVVCSGIETDKKQTYALLEERVPRVKELHKEEALAKLAMKYFRSHSPASLPDFVWWSGLSTGEARHAMWLIESELIPDRFLSCDLYVHQSCNIEAKPDDVLHFLPSYDEYLISYKDRTSVLEPEYYSKAFNAWGIFYPVIMHNGKIIGNWNKSTGKGRIDIETSFFGQYPEPERELIKMAENRYKTFIS